MAGSVLTLEHLSARLAVAGDALPKALRRTLIAAAARAEGLAKANVEGNHRMRTGMLRRSIGATLEEQGLQTVIRLRAGGGAEDVKYARVQEKDGKTVIRPKNGKYLAIPIGNALTTAGVAKYASPRDMPGLSFAQSRNGQPMLVLAQRGKVQGVRGKVQAGDVMYLLRTSVTVQGRPFLKPAADEVISILPATIRHDLAEAVKQEVSRGG